MIKITRLTIVLILLVSVTKIYAQKRYAVLVGINEYYDRPGVMHGSILRGCVNDVMSVRALLLQRFGYKDADIRVITNAQATKANVMTGLKDMLSECEAGDAVLFYFSGHGMWMTNQSQNALDTTKKHGLNQAMVMSDLYAKNLDCLFTDAEVKTIFNFFIDKKAVPTAVFDCCFSGLLSTMPTTNEWAPYILINPFRGKDRAMSSEDIVSVNEAYNNNNAADINLDSLNDLRLRDTFAAAAEKAVRMSSLLTINNAAFVQRPAERSGSRFLSLSAASAYEPSLEIADETGFFHGAFTQALLHVLNTSPANISAAQLIGKIEQQMHLQSYPQTPAHAEDPERLKGNLLGISAAGFKNNITVKYISRSGEGLLLNGGNTDGVFPGNVLEGSGVTLEVVSAKNSEAAAKLIRGNEEGLKPGAELTVTDRYIKSAPLIKVYAEASNWTNEKFNAFVKDNATPYLHYDTFWDYEHWSPSYPSVNYFLNDTSRRSMLNIKNQFFLVWLPIPAYLYSVIKNKLLADQNATLVSDRTKADLCLYLNYVKGRNGGKPHFVFIWYKLGGETNAPGELMFTNNHLAIPDLNFDSKTAAAVADKIIRLLTTPIRIKTDRWLNEWLKKQ